MQSLLSVLAGGSGRTTQESKPQGDFEVFIQEVNNENVEYLSFRRELDAQKEIKPTFEQISQERILDEGNKNIQVLKSLETILQERSQAFDTFLSAQAKYKSSFDIFQYCEGTMRQALDALFVFLEQDFQQARQQQLLGDLRRVLSEVKVDAQKRLVDYQREVNNAEKEVANTEKKLSKSKDALEKLLELKRELKHKLEMGDHQHHQDPLMSPRMPGGILSRSISSSSHRETNRLEKLRECEENILKCDKDIREDIRNLLRVLGRRDHVLIASRRAYQKLDRECKRAVAHAFKKIVIREREAAMARESGLCKLEQAVQRIDIDSDLDDFIIQHRSPDDEALQLSSQALTVLWDLMVPDGETHAVSSAAAVNIPVSLPGENHGSQSPIASGKAGSNSSSNHPSRVSSPISQMMALRGNTGTGTGIHTEGGVGMGLGDGQSHGSEESTIPHGHTYGTGDVQDTPHRHVFSSIRHPLVVNDATLMIESTDQINSLVGNHLSGYSMGSIPEAVAAPPMIDFHSTPPSSSSSTRFHRRIIDRPGLMYHPPSSQRPIQYYRNAITPVDGRERGGSGGYVSNEGTSKEVASSGTGTSAGLAVAASASATLSLAVTSGLPIAEAFASIVGMYGPSTSNNSSSGNGNDSYSTTSGGAATGDNPSYPASSVSTIHTEVNNSHDYASISSPGRGIGYYGENTTTHDGSNDSNIEDVSLDDAINEHLNSIFYGPFSPFSPLPMTGEGHRTEDGTEHGEVSQGVTSEVQVTPVRIIGSDEVTIGTGRNAQLLLPIPGEGDTQLLENLQIEDYIDAEGSSGGGSRSTTKSSSQAPSSHVKNVNTLTTTTTTSATSLSSNVIPSTPMKTMMAASTTTMTEGYIHEKIMTPSHASPTTSSSSTARDAWMIDTKAKEGDRVDGDGLTKNDHVVRPTPTSLDPTPLSPHYTLDESVTWLSNVVTTQKGRDSFISALNQFRSKKVEVGDGFSALGAVLWDLLDQCSVCNDVHSAKVIMMLSQTFYRRRKPSSTDLLMYNDHERPLSHVRETATTLEILHSTATVSTDSEPASPTTPLRRTATSSDDSYGDVNHWNGGHETTRDVDYRCDNKDKGYFSSKDPMDGSADAESEAEDRSSTERRHHHNSSSAARQQRDYLKEMLIAHTLWRDGNFWEQALWQCTIEQLQTIPYERAWYDMDGNGRAEAVRRVHNVIFSQVMAITHSMIELGCSKTQTREFLYRMCSVHQLSERQRQQLLSHLLSR